MSPARILIVEDTPHNMDLMRYLLSARNHEIYEATRGLDGVELARSHSHDLVVLDLGLPDVDGFEVLRRLREDARLPLHVPVIAVTAFAMVGDRDRVLAAGFNGYIAKPIEPESFVDRVEAHLPPEMRSEQAAASPAQTQPARPRVEREPRAVVLVVDNMVENLELARSLLEPSGYKVVTAGGVDEALKALAEGVPDAILSDIHMPEADGYALLHAVRAQERTREVPFAFISASYSPERELDLAAADDFIVRPIDPPSLLNRVQRLLAISRPRISRLP